MVGVLSSDERAAARTGHIRQGEVSQRTLIRELSRLKWTLWKRSFRKNIGKLIGTIFGGLYAVGALVGLTFALIGLTLTSGDGAHLAPLVQLIGVLVTFLWTMIPLVAFGVDDTLDPRRFALYSRSPRELQPGMFIASAIGLPVLFTAGGTLLLSVFEAIWLIQFGAGPAAIALGLLVLVPANLGAVVLCLLLPRAILAHQAGRSSSRRFRELGSTIGMVVMIGALYGISLAFQRIDGESIQAYIDLVSRAAGILAWTPLGALFSAPLDFGAGNYLTGLARLVIGAATIILLWLWWRSSLGAALTSALVGDSSSGTTTEKPLIPRGAPQSPLGASIGRSLRYWRRDSRYIAAVAIMPLMLVFFTAMGALGPSGPTMGVIGLVLIAGLGGLSLMNEIGFDGPSGWVNITAGIDGRANLAGRVIALSLMAVPFMVLSAIAVPLILGIGDLLPMLVPGTLGMLLGGLGVSTIIGVLLPYPTSPPGTNPMKDKSASSANAMIAMTVAMVAVWIPQLPALGLGIWGTVTGSAALQLTAGLLSLVVGVVVVVVGVHVAGRIYDRRVVDLFQKVRSFL